MYNFRYSYPDKFHWKTRASLKAESLDIFFIYLWNAGSGWLVSQAGILSSDSTLTRCPRRYSLSAPIAETIQMDKHAYYVQSLVVFIYSSWAHLSLFQDNGAILKIHHLQWCLHGWWYHGSFEHTGNKLITFVSKLTNIFFKRNKILNQVKITNFMSI